MKSLTSAHTRLMVVLSILLAGSPASSTERTYRFDMTISRDDWGLFGVGNPFVMTMTFDDTSPDIREAPDFFYTRLSPWGGVTTSESLIEGPNRLEAISADSTQGFWVANGRLDSIIDYNFVMQLFGDGLVADQILPRFETINGGVLKVGNPQDPVLKASLDALVAVPEPTTALLLGLGLVAVAVHRRRRF